MGPSEKNEVGTREIDLIEVAKLLWFNRYIFLFSFIISIFASIGYIRVTPPTFVANAVFEKPAVGNQQESSNENRSLGVLGGLLGVSSNFSSDKENLFSVIKSKSFLQTVLVDNQMLDRETLYKFCPLPTGLVPPLSIRSLLVFMGVSTNNTPDENQKVDFLVDCIKEKLTIQNDQVDDVKTSAIKVIIKSHDPHFSANLANQIVEKYFIWHEKYRDIGFRNIKNYLSDTILEAQNELNEANKLKQEFIIRHALLGDIRASFENNNTKENLSPFRIEMVENIATLGQLEKSKALLKEAELKLSTLQKLNTNKIEDFMLSSQLQAALSRTFISFLSQYENTPNNFSARTLSVQQSLEQELNRLKDQIQVIDKKIKEKESKTLKLMNIESRFQALSLDLEKKRLAFESLKDQLNKKILTAGLDKIHEPLLLTTATAPLSQSSPNKKLVVLIGVLISLILGLLYSVVWQIYQKRIFSLGQVDRLSNELNSYQIKLKQLTRMKEIVSESAISKSVFSNAKNFEKLGCIVDLSKRKNRNKSLAKTFTEAFGNLLAVGGTKIVCLHNTIDKGLSFSKNQLDASFQTKKFNSLESKGTLVLEEEEGLIETIDLSSIKKRYADFNKILCALDCDVVDPTKFNFIEKCDFYVLIGKSFEINEFMCNKFLNKAWEREKKCLGFFLVD